MVEESNEIGFAEDAPPRGIHTSIPCKKLGSFLWLAHNKREKCTLTSVNPSQSTSLESQHRTKEYSNLITFGYKHILSIWRNSKVKAIHMFKAHIQYCHMFNYETLHSTPALLDVVLHYNRVLTHTLGGKNIFSRFHVYSDNLIYYRRSAGMWIYLATMHRIITNACYTHVTTKLSIIKQLTSILYIQIGN